MTKKEAKKLVEECGVWAVRFYIMFLSNYIDDEFSTYDSLYMSDQLLAISRGWTDF